MTLLLKRTFNLLPLITALYTETKHMGLCMLPTVKHSLPAEVMKHSILLISENLTWAVGYR